MSSLPLTERPDEAPIVIDLARRLGRVPTPAEAIAAVEAIDTYERAVFAAHFARAPHLFRTYR